MHLLPLRNSKRNQRSLSVARTPFAGMGDETDSHCACHIEILYQKVIWMLALVWAGKAFIHLLRTLAIQKPGVGPEECRRVRAKVQRRLLGRISMDYGACNHTESMLVKF